MAIRHRTPFAPEFNFVVVRPFTFNGRDYGVGEEFDKANVNVRLLQRLHEQGKLNAVIPSLTIRKDTAEAEPDATAMPPEAPPAPAKGKPGRKPKAAATEEQAAPEPAAAPANRYRLEANFGVVRIMEGDTVVRECADLEEAKAAMAELAGE